MMTSRSDTSSLRYRIWNTRDAPQSSIMVAVEPVVPEPVVAALGDPLVPWEPPPALPLPPMPLLLLGVVPNPGWHPLEELVEMGVLALLDTDPGALLVVVVPVTAEVEPVPEPAAEVMEFGGADAEAAAVAATTAEGTPVVEASGRHVST